MRPWGDYDVPRDFKQASVWELRTYGFDLRLAIEDDRRNVEMFRGEGRPVHLLPLRLLRLSRSSGDARVRRGVAAAGTNGAGVAFAGCRADSVRGKW